MTAVSITAIICVTIITLSWMGHHYNDNRED